MIELPHRSKRYGVGKDIAGNVYVHRRYEDVLGETVRLAVPLIPAGFEYHVVKLDRRSGAVSFVHCPDFDVVDEPVVGDVVTVRAAGTVNLPKQPADPELYHHKWLFVADDYDGFDVEASKAWSDRWTSLDAIDRSRIGKRSYWEREVLPRLESKDAGRSDAGQPVSLETGAVHRQD